MNFKRTTVTAALPYANGPVHIGHLAGVYVPADVYVRYLRSKGEDVAFICGSDEHGVAITLRAKKEGITPKEVVDKYDALIRRSMEEFGISFDIYSRTSSPVHHETAAGFFKALHDKGAFEEKVTEQFFDEEAQQFLADRYIKGECPNCHFTEAYGDQCENCGSSLSPMELINPVSVLSGNQPVRKKTKHWYLPMNNYESWLRNWILQQHQEWKPNVYGQCKSWLDGGLQPRAMTRDLDWGVKVPLNNAEGKVLYVWFDAPIGYISATKEWAAKEGKSWELYWKDAETRLLHFIGKDNIVFHCIIFPAILKAEGSYILPDNVPANEFLNLEGNKISTSRNWAVWLHEYLAEFPDKQDALRYTLCANAPESKDNDFTWADFQAKNNNELVAVLGNFVNRAVVLTQKYFDGKVPEKATMFDLDNELITAARKAPQVVARSLDQFKFREALTNMMELARAGNKYLAETEPWKLVKSDKERVGTILNLALQIAANLSILMEPFLPFTARKLADMLNTKGWNWNEAGKDNLLAIGHQLKHPILLFEKIDDAQISEQVEKLTQIKASNKNEPPMNPLKETINFEDFQKLDLRIATVLEAEKVKKSKKLLKLTLDTGLDKRTVLSGIAEHYSAEQIIGKQVVVLVNLAPRTLMGFESQGMVLMIENVSGELVFLTGESPVKNGSVIS